MRIPVGNFGNEIAAPAPRVNVPDGAFGDFSGLKRLGDTGVALAGDAIAEQRLEARRAEAERKAEAKRLKADQIETEVKQADTELNRRLSALQYDPKVGYFTKSGSGAVSDYEPTITAVKQIASEIGGGISDPEAKRIYDLASGPRVNHATESISRYAMTQNRVVQVSTSESRAKQYIDSAAAAYGDDAVFNVAMDTLRNEAERQGQLLGLDEFSVALRKKAYESSAWEKRFAAARMADPLFALALFQKNPGALDPDKRDNMGAALFSAAAPLMANDLVMRGVHTQAKNEQEAEALAVAANQAGLKFRIATGESFGSFAATTFSQLPADMKLRVIAIAKQQMAQSNSLATHQVSALMRDAEAAALDGKRIPVDPALFSAFGPQAAEMKARYDNSQVMADTISQVRIMPVAERMTAIQKAAPAVAGAGYAEAVQRAHAVRQAVAQVNQMQTDDPVSFTMQTSPGVVKPAFDALQAAMMDVTAPMDRKRAAAQAFAVATIAEQERLGDTPQQAGILARPKPILPNSMANAISEQFVAKPEGGQQPAQLIQMQSDMWGSHWPQVYAQIAKNIGPTARVIANMKDTPAASLLSMMANMKIEEIRKTLPPADAKAVDDAIDSQMFTARETLSEWTTGGLSTFNDYHIAATRLAYSYVGKDTSPTEAAKRAAREVFYDAYEIVGRARIPKIPGVDPRVVDQGMVRALAEADKLQLRIPPDEAAILGADYTSKQLAASLKHSGFFVTLGDDSGVALWMRGGNGNRAVEGANGKGITFTWKQLQDLAARPDKPPTALEFGGTPGGAATGVRAPPRGP